MLERHGGIRNNASKDEGHASEADVDVKRLPAERDSDLVVELIYAASEGDLSAIFRLVARGADLEQGDYDLRTPLHLAAAEGHDDAVALLDKHWPTS